MTAGRVSRDLIVPAGAVAIAVLWPLSAYLYSPEVLPALLLCAGAAALIFWRPVYGIALALTVLPFRTVVVHLPRGGAVQPLKFLLPLLAFGMLAYGVVSLREERGWRVPGVAVAGVAVVAVAIASTMQAVEPSRAVGEILQLSTAVALFLAAVLICRRRDHLLAISAGAVAGLLLASVEGIFQQVTGHFSGISLAVEGEEIGRIAGSFGHPNQYAGYLAVLIPLAAVLALSARIPAALRVFSAAAVVLALPALSFSYTRGAIGGLVAGALTWLLLVRPKATIPVILACVLAFAFAFPGVLKDRLEAVDGGDVALRSDLWQSALTIFSEQPVLGVGVDNFSTAYSALPATQETAAERHLLHGDQVLVPPHANNFYLTLLAEQGVLGVLAVTLLALLAFGVAYRAAHGTDPVLRAVGIGLGAGLLTFAAHNVLEVTFLEVLAPLLVLTGGVAAVGQAVSVEAAPASAARPGRGIAAPLLS